MAGDAGDGNEHDFVVWEQPRLVAPGRPDLLLRDVRDVARRARGAARASLRLARPSAWARRPRRASAKGQVDLAALARRHGVEPAILAAWLDYLGIGTGGAAVKIDTPLTGKITNASGYDFVNGWGSGEICPTSSPTRPSQHVRIPGNLKPHSVAMHPSPTLRVAAGWLSPVSAVLRVEGRVQHAHPECGNGVTWSLELRRGAVRQKLAAGVAQGAKEVTVGPVKDVAVQPGDLVSLLIGPRDGNHACDLTAVDLTLAGGGREWNLAREVSPDILAGNPHADAHGNPGVWHFYTEPDKGGPSESVIPAGSLLARWQSAATAEEKATAGAGAARRCSSRARRRRRTVRMACLYRQLSSLRGPLVERRSRSTEPGTGPASRTDSIRNSRRSGSTRRSSASTRAARRSTPRASACMRPRCWRFACRPTWSRAASS